MAVLTMQEVKNYIRVDFDDDDILIASLMDTADALLKGSIGTNYNNEDERAKMLSLLIISDLYDNRGVNEKVSGNIRKIIEDMSLQMKLELRA